MTINNEKISLETNSIDEIQNEKRKISWEDEIDYQEKYNRMKENYLMLYEDYLQMKMNK